MRGVVEDAGSRNGTFVKNERVERRALDDGDVFEAGHSLFMLRDALATPPTSANDLDSTDLRGVAPGLRTLVPALAPRYEELARVARSDVSIVLLGETGTGKELVARAAHELSGRPGAFFGTVHDTHAAHAKPRFDAEVIDRTGGNGNRVQARGA